jgi:hypothetical protein
MKNSVKNKVVPILILLYLFLPFVIFCLGWIKPVFSVPILIVLFICFYRMVKGFPDLWLPRLSKEETLKVGFILCIIILWVYLSGIGGFVAQSYDAPVRNAIFQVLVEKKWPVYNFDRAANTIRAPIALVYYFGWWLPPAIVGKMFGLTVGLFAQAVWAVLGIGLFYYMLVAKFIKKIVLWPLLVFVFFSGLDVLGMYLIGERIYIPYTTHLERWVGPFQFSSMTTQLFWVYNQAVPVWVATMLLLMQKNNRYAVLIIALTMLTSTMPFVGLIVIAGCMIIKNYIGEILPYNSNKFKEACRNLFTFENIAGGGVVGIISFLFLKTNIAASVVRLYATSSIKGITLVFIVFYFVEVMVYLIAIYKYQKRNWLYYCSAVWLAICPWIFVGNYNHDFCMRASIPALVILFCLVADTLNKSLVSGKRDYITVFALAVLLLAGSVTSQREMTRTIADTLSNYENGLPIVAESHTKNIGDNHLGYIEGNVFFDYLAKR